MWTHVAWLFAGSAWFSFMTDQRSPNQKLAEAIEFGIEARNRLDALLEVLEARRVITHEDILEIESLAAEKARQYEKDLKLQ
jgi:hypothetical protein